jgi:putative membrane protein insertion efficiency factor
MSVPTPVRVSSPASLPARMAVGILRAYKAVLSPWLPRACRYEPTCSVYAREAIERHGLRRGSWLAVRRLMRCHPFRRGGFDPVP